MKRKKNRRLIVAVLTFPIFIFAIITICLRTVLSVSFFTEEEVIFTYVDSSGYPADSVAQMVEYIAERYHTVLTTPESTNEAAIIVDENGRHYCCFYISYNDGISGDFTLHLLNGDIMECRDGWIITPDRRLLFLDTQKWADKAASTSAKLKTHINGVFVYMEWPSFSRLWLMKLLIKQDWFLQLGICIFKHWTFSRSIISMVIWFMFIYELIYSIAFYGHAIRKLIKNCRDTCKVSNGD